MHILESLVHFLTWFSLLNCRKRSKDSCIFLNHLLVTVLNKRAPKSSYEKQSFATFVRCLRTAAILTHIKIHSSIPLCLLHICNVFKWEDTTSRLYKLHIICPPPSLLFYLALKWPAHGKILCRIRNTSRPNLVPRLHSTQLVSQCEKNCRWSLWERGEVQC